MKNFLTSLEKLDLEMSEIPFGHRLGIAILAVFFVLVYTFALLA